MSRYGYQFQCRDLAAVPSTRLPDWALRQIRVSMPRSRGGPFNSTLTPPSATGLDVSMPRSRGGPFNHPNLSRRTSGDKESSHAAP